MKILAMICFFLSLTAFARERTIHVSHTGTCSNTIERNRLGILTQKSKLKACAEEDALEVLYYKCETKKAGQLVSHTESGATDCISQIVWGGRFMKCFAEVSGECLIDH